MKRFINIVLIGFVVFNYSFSLNGQSLTSALPNNANLGAKLDVVIRGTGTQFSQGITSANFGNGITVHNTNVLNSETVVASITVAQNTNLGLRDITVTTQGNILTLINGFEVFEAGNNFKANVEVLPYQNFNISDFDITNPQKQPITFFVNLFNDNTTRKVNVSIKVITEKWGEVVELSVLNLGLNQMQTLRINNRDFNRLTVKQPNGNAFIEDAKNKGTMPPDNYTYKLTVTNEQGTVIAQDEGKTVVTNPIFNPELISPGILFSRTPEIISIPFPLFQWFSQSDKFTFSLHKVLPNQTAEEVVRNIAVYKKEGITGSSLLYPTSAEKLLDGQQYAWQIVAEVATSNGIKRLPSTVFNFIYKSNATIADNKNMVDRIVILPDDISLKTNQQYQFTIQILNKDGAILNNITPELKLIPNKGSINHNGLFTAPPNPSTMALVVKVGSTQSMATINIKYGDEFLQKQVDELTEEMFRKLFGLPNKKN